MTIAVDTADLATVVRQALASPDAQIRKWSCERLELVGGPMTDSIHRLHGTARNGVETLDWSLILKILKRVDFHYLIERLGPDHSDSLDSDRAWTNEALLFRSGIFDGWEGGLLPVRCFRAVEVGDDSIWLWLEDLGEPGAAWTLERNELAARHLGELNGAHLERRGPLPWLLKSFIRGHLANMQPPEGWDHALVSDDWEHPAVRAVFPPGTSGRLLKLLKGSGVMLDWLAAQPQTLSHQDADRRNLFSRRAADGRDLTVAIDWQMVGLSAVGEDLGSFVFGSLHFLQADVWRARELHDAALSTYQDGLRSAGCRDDLRGVGLAQDLRGMTHLVMVPWNVQSLAQEAKLVDLVTSRATLLGYTSDEATERWAASVRYTLDVVERAAREVG